MSGNSILSEAEIEAALSEIESMSGNAEQIPSLDDGKASGAVAIPVNLGPSKAAPPPKPARPQAAAPKPAATTAPPQAATPAAQPDSSAAGDTATAHEQTWRPPTFIERLHQAIVPQPIPDTIEEPPPPTAEAGGTDGTADSRPAPAPTRGIAHQARLAVDVVLELGNMPFRWVPAPARWIVGIVGAVTLILATLAVVGTPWLRPSRGAVEFVRQTAAEVRPAAAPGTTPTAPVQPGDR